MVMKVDQQEIIAYIMHELPAERQDQVRHLIQQDHEWTVEFEKWSVTMTQLNNEKTLVRSPAGIPDRYWNSFLPRVRERIDAKEQKRRVFRERFIHAVPSFGLAVLILFFMHNVLITNKKIDYLLDQYNWVRSLNTSKVIDQYIDNNVASADDFIKDVFDFGKEGSATISDWDDAYNPTESVLDYSSLTHEEQKELLENLEKTTTF